MSFGNTLLIFTPWCNEPPVLAAATPDVRNGHPTLDFDDTLVEAAVFTGILPRHYGGGGLTVRLHWAATAALSGTVGWDVAFERVGPGGQDLDADGFAPAAAAAPVETPATNGQTAVSSAVVAPGPAMADLAAGDVFRLRVRRDPAADTAAGDAELLAVELLET